MGSITYFDFHTISQQVNGKFTDGILDHVLMYL